MLKLRCNNNGVKAFYFINFFNRHIFHSNFFSSISKEDNQSFTNYFVETLGFSKQNAASTSTKLDSVLHSKGYKSVSFSKHISNAISVVEFLKKSGLSDSQIRVAVSSYPNVLLAGVDKTLKPKVDYFLNFGFSKSDFGEVVSVNPDVLLNGIKYMKAIEALTDVLTCNDDVISIMKKSHWTSASGMTKNLVANVALLRNYGVSNELIRKRLFVHMSVFLRKTELFRDVLIRVEEKLGIPRGDSSRFMNGVRLLSSFSEENIESKIKMFEEFGWTRSDVLELTRRSPLCLALSEARVRRSLEYLMEELGYDPPYLISRSALLTYSLEKRIMPRNSVLLALKKKGLIKMDCNLYSTLLLKDSMFVEKFVVPFDQEVGEIYAKYTRQSLVNPPTEDRAGVKP